MRYDFAWCAMVRKPRGSMGKRGRGGESDEELWARVAVTATPLKKDHGAKAHARDTAPGRPARREDAKAEPKPSPKPPVKRAPAPSRSGLDRQTARKLETGRLLVEARLDLHGMRQRDAHAALRKFLKWAQSKDYRHVLVITGKGAAAEERKSFYQDEERGVLRSAVPHWLGQPDLAPVVISFSAAPRRLGGDGALYVRLRKGSDR
jgi:DNA-nicking Smr family endonuclease